MVLKPQAVANFYELDPDEQRRRSLARLFRYLRRYVGPYHPFLRRRYRELGVHVSRLKTLDDLRRLPLITKADLRENPQAFVMRPAFPVVPQLEGFATCPPTKGMLLKYAWQGLLNRPFDHTQQFRRPALRDCIRRR